jgi:hypothetical protein
MKKKEPRIVIDDDISPEYDFSKMKLVGRGIYAERYRSGTNIVLLDRDVRKAFPDDREINETLREVAKARRKASRAKKSPVRKTASRSRRAA